jgi:hypothetical protein
MPGRLIAFSCLSIDGDGTSFLLRRKRSKCPR